MIDIKNIHNIMLLKGELDVCDFNEWVKKNPEVSPFSKDSDKLYLQIREISIRYMFEFDTPENRKIIYEEIEELVNSYIINKREEKLIKILECQ